MRRVAFVLFLIVLSAISLLALKTTSTNTTLLAPTNNADNSAAVTGVFGDGGGVYANGVGKVQSFMGAGGKDTDLVTYSTVPSRTLNYVFPSATGSSLPQSFSAESDFYGINFFGPYVSMAVGTTAQVHGTLQFHQNGQTWQLDYPALGVYRVNATTWQISSNSFDLTGFNFNPGFSIGSTATLSLKRNKGNVLYGNFAMPINFSFSTN